MAERGLEGKSYETGQCNERDVLDFSVIDPFWIPVIGPLVAGFVGGRKAGSVGNAVLAVFLPGVIFGIAFFFLATMLTGFALFGIIAGFGGIALAMLHVGPLLLGAILGAVL